MSDAGAQLASLIRERQPCVVLTGAGISTESGIPDFRSAGGLWERFDPLELAHVEALRRDPARVWEFYVLRLAALADAEPNDGHRALAGLEERGWIRGVVTQNVDGLHQAAGARSVIELHGSLAQVTCLGCGELITREELHQRLHAANPAFRAEASAINPDGDVDLMNEGDFRVVDCRTCLGGVLKPDVVFFGETVPVDRVEAAYALVERANLLLVLGSSLMVMSGRRFVIRAVKLGIPVAIVNQGVTRADASATLTLDAPLGVVLPELVDRAVPLGVNAP